MGQLLRNWRVLTATVFSVVLIVGAFFLARGIEFPRSAEASAETALLQAIAKKDTDGDGLPDWEESLYGTDSSVVDTNKLGMTDGEAVEKGLIVPKAIADVSTAASSSSAPDANGLTPPAPGSLTDAFAKSFFSEYAAAKEAAGGADLTESQIDDVSNKAVSSLAATVSTPADFKSPQDITVSGSGAEAMKAFAVGAEAVLLKNTADATKTQLGYLKDILDKNDTTAVDHLTSLATMYRSTAAGLAALPVPQELAATDLALINALMRISGITNDFAGVNADPLPAMLALKQYMTVTQALGKAFIDVGTVYASAGITLPAKAPGALFVNMIADIAASNPPDLSATQKP